MSEPAAMCGEFIVRASFTITGRGTCAAGYLTSGDFRRGDSVRWSTRDGVRHATCSGFTTITERPGQQPPTVGLMLADAEPGEFVEGMTLTIFR